MLIPIMQEEDLDTLTKVCCAPKTLKQSCLRQINKQDKNLLQINKTKTQRKIVTPRTIKKNSNIKRIFTRKKKEPRKIKEMLLY